MKWKVHFNLSENKWNYLKLCSNYDKPLVFVVFFQNIYGSRSLNVSHLVYFVPQNLKLGKLWTNTELPGAASVSLSVPALAQATWELTGGTWELRMRPQLLLSSFSLIYRGRRAREGLPGVLPTFMCPMKGQFHWIENESVRNCSQSNHI